MNLQEYFDEFCRKKAILEIQYGYNSDNIVKGSIVLSEDDFIVLRTVVTLGDAKTLGDGETLGGKDTLIPHSMICVVRQRDESNNYQLFVN